MLMEGRMNHQSIMIGTLVGFSLHVDAHMYMPEPEPTNIRTNARTNGRMRTDDQVNERSHANHGGHCKSSEATVLTMAGMKINLHVKLNASINAVTVLSRHCVKNK